MRVMGCLIASVLLLVPTAAQTQPASPPDAPADIARIEAAVDRGLVYLARHQRADGSWPCVYGNNTGVNAICALAFMGRGHAPGRGPYGELVQRTIRLIRDHQTDAGLYTSVNDSRGTMYEHALATLAMIEAYGFMPDEAMRSSIQKAVDLIVKAQNPEGGWRYHPIPADADLSASAMQIVTLRAAINARFTVPQETLTRALAYVRSNIVESGGFTYQPGIAHREPVSAAGCLAMQFLDAFDDPAVARGLEYVRKDGVNTNSFCFWYFAYYATQAHFQAGGEHWAAWQPQISAFMLENQRADGSWTDYGAYALNDRTNCASTGFALMSLEVFMHYLPAYQR